MKEIRLTKGKVALVDDEDFEWLSKWIWQAYPQKGGYCVAARSGGNRIKRTMIFMHRVITDAPKEMDVDHLDHNGLNNQKYNLRVCTHYQNMHNRRSNKNSTSKYKGVSWHKGNKCWQANISIDGKQINLGYSKDEIKAAKMYDAAAKIQHGEFAFLNFPE